eukprot:CAMPEP_0170190642 /NCGR_PEP_ID=MMETSP0040_2-20121228/49774_1 /TAXON_ID=641309 /ORGANISM="Lotharella oceanica, Strain CCMP622" /LENGTH=80 /DNA_ID=CAMNT_0010438551 /DNA_START=40 /DNA_END=282 /DNA_ORIENTATION=+
MGQGLPYRQGRYAPQAIDPQLRHEALVRADRCPVHLDLAHVFLHRLLGAPSFDEKCRYYRCRARSSLIAVDENPMPLFDG